MGLIREHGYIGMRCRPSGVVHPMNMSIGRSSAYRYWGSDAELAGYLRQGVYRQPYVRFVLWEIAIAEQREFDANVSQLFSACQVDHILPQKPMIDLSACGFASEEEYASEIKRFGNLCLLEQKLNGGAGNVPIAIKADYYVRSCLEATRVLGHILMETGFRREDIEGRGQRIVAFFQNRWPISAGDAAPAPEENEEDSFDITALEQT